MTSETDSSSSTLAKDHKRRKKNKKLKMKSKKLKKKEKRKKSKKERKRRSSSSDKQPILNVSVAQPVEGNIIIDDAFGPALPPHLQKQVPENESPKRLIGPVMPSGICISEIETLCSESEEFNTYGPLPIPVDNSPTISMSTAQIELEQRALELKLAAMQGQPLNKSDNHTIREEWMLELPEVGLKTGLSSLENMKRTFYQGKERPDFSDRTSWTKTPNSEKNLQKPTTSKLVTEKLKRNAEANFEKQRDEEQEQLAKKHKKKHKREESLVEMHQKKLRREQKMKEKELAASGVKPERRPFSRDIDLKLNKIDKNQTKQIVDKAKILNTKFAEGKTKYL